jgi:hypothetical protein
MLCCHLAYDLVNYVLEADRVTLSELNITIADIIVILGERLLHAWFNEE